MRSGLVAALCAAVCTLCAFGLVRSASAESIVIDAAQAARNRIDYAGRQRMLSQHIARNSCFVMAGIDPDRFAAKTEAAVRQFAVAHKGLRAGDANLGLLAEQNVAILDQLGDHDSRVSGPSISGTTSL